MHGHAMNPPPPSPQDLLACIGDLSRYRLVLALRQGARCVTDLASEVGLSQSCTTRHLQALERRRVLRRSREGKRVVYRLSHDEPALGPLLAWALGGGEGGRRGAVGHPEDAADGLDPVAADAGGGVPGDTSPRRAPRGKLTQRERGARAGSGAASLSTGQSPSRRAVENLSRTGAFSDSGGLPDPRGSVLAPETPGANREVTESTTGPDQREQSGRPLRRRDELEDYLL
jgi:ArsR family transcriptional regulator